jgi:hypothetical protein
MIYLVFPEADYTYEPILLSRFLLKHSDILNKAESAPSRQITCMLQVPSHNNLLYFYKDVRWNDPDYTAERIRRLKGNNLVTETALNESGLVKMTGVKFSDVGNDNPHHLKYKIRYEVQFKEDNPIHVNLLVHTCETNPFLSLAHEFAASHKTEPVLFHNARGLNWESRFSGFADALIENGFRHFCTPEGFQKKLIKETDLKNVNQHGSFAGYRLYTLSL